MQNIDKFMISMLLGLFVILYFLIYKVQLDETIAKIESNYSDCILVDVGTPIVSGDYVGHLWGRVISNNNNIIGVDLDEYSYDEALKIKGKICSLKVVNYGQFNYYDDNGNYCNYCLEIKEVLE